MAQTDIVIAVVIHDQRILVRLGPEESHWSLPTAKLSADQTPAEAALQLTSGFPDLAIEADEPLPPFAMDISGGEHMIHPFMCHCAGNVADELSDGAQWIAIHELTDFAFDPASSAVILWLTEHHGPPDDEHQRQNELDALRIRQVAKARQAAMRAGSYCLIASLACAVVAIDLAWRAVRRYALEHSLPRPAIYLLAIIPIAWFCHRFWLKAAELRKEARLRSLPDPISPPDFSGLSDGSHVVRNLESMK